MLVNKSLLWEGGGLKNPIDIVREVFSSKNIEYVHFPFRETVSNGCRHISFRSPNIGEESFHRRGWKILGGREGWGAIVKKQYRYFILRMGLVISTN